MAHATGGAQCCQKRRERGYYHLHRQLNDPLLLHSSMCFSVVRGSGGQPLLRLEARDYFCVGLSVLRLFSYHRTLVPPHPRNLSVATGVVGCGRQEVGDRRGQRYPQIRTFTRKRLDDWKIMLNFAALNIKNMKINNKTDI